MTIKIEWKYAMNLKISDELNKNRRKEKESKKIGSKKK